VIRYYTIILQKKMENKKIIIRNFDSRKIFLSILTVFSTFLVIDLISNFLEFIIIDMNLNGDFFIFLYLDKIFLNIGLIGIISIFFSYYCYKKKKDLFSILMSWILFSFILGSISIFFHWIENFSIPPSNILAHDYLYMNIWFDRIWFYAIPPLCIIASIGGFEFVKNVNNLSFFQGKRLNIKLFLKDVAFSIFILLTSSGIMLFGMWMVNSDRIINDEEAMTIGWISENIPPDSKIVITNFPYQCAITMTYSTVFYADEIFNNNNPLNEQQLIFLITSNIRYIIISREFISQSSNVSIFINEYLIPNFYNVTLYQNREFNVSYAPFFG